MSFAPDSPSVSAPTTAAEEGRLPEGLDALVLPGMPGRPSPGGVESPYPDLTTDIVKLLREQGLSVDYAQAREQRQTVTLKAAEFWVPILVFTADAAANGAGALLAQSIMALLGKAQSRRQLLHVRCGYQTDKETRWFQGDGPPDDVLKALRQWGRQR